MYFSGVQKFFAPLKNFLKRLFPKKNDNFSREVGVKSEAIAANYLKHKGLKILTRNWRYKRYEIDIIGLDQQEVLVFIEVRARSDRAKQSGYYTVDHKKKHAIKIAVKAYLKCLPKPSPAFRFDILEIEWHLNEGYTCRHFENVPLFPQHFY